MRRTLTLRLLAALAVVMVSSTACRGSGDGYDQPTRASVFADLDVTSRRYLEVPVPYAARALSPDDPALAARDRANRLIGNGLGTTDLRAVSRDGAEVAVMQVTVFSALAPAESPGELVAGFLAGAAATTEVVAGQSVVRVGDGPVVYVWRAGRTVVTISGADPAIVGPFVAAYLKGKSSGS